MSTGFIIKETEEEVKYSNKFNIENWYNFLKEETFYTEFMEISQEQAKAIVEKILEKNKTSENTERIISKLTKDIDSKIKRVNPGGCFVRLSTRSPKDSVEVVERCRNIIMKELFDKLYDIYQTDFVLEENGKLKKGDVVSPRNLGHVGFYQQQNEILKLIRKGINKALRVASGEQFMELLLKSERVLRDLRIALNYPKLYDMKFIIRDFVKGIELKNEFRAFVYKNELNAITQYDKDVYHEDITENVNKIAKIIREYWEKKIKKVLSKYENYVIDFVILGNDVKVIELNPFDKHTGACLFGWEKDRKIFENGPFEIRVLKEAPRFKHLLWTWEDLLEECRSKTNKQRTKDKVMVIFLIIALLIIFILLYILFEYIADRLTRK